MNTAKSYIFQECVLYWFVGQPFTKKYMLNIDDDKFISLLMKKKNKDTDRGNAVLCYTDNKNPQVVHFEMLNIRYIDCM